MSITYTATYYNASNRFYAATIFLSSVTITIRYKDETGVEKDVYWLSENIVSLDTKELESVLIYKNKEGQTERLLIRNPQLVSAIRKNFSHRKFTGGYTYVLGGTRSKILLVFSILVSLLLLGYFLFIPWLGEKVAMNFSKEKEISLGEQMYQSVIASYKTDQRKTKLLNEFYKELRFNTSYPITITVVQSGETNAFAIPGGHIVVYDAILDGMKTPAELAALLGHEASHVELRHSLRNMFRSLARKMFLLLILGNDSGIAGFLAEHADNLKGLEYSRSLETQADDNGLRLMNQSGIDPSGMLRLMELLQKETGSAEPSRFLSTHPIFSERIANIKKKIQDSPDSIESNPRLTQLFREIY